jgi:hypothetical protein
MEYETIRVNADVVKRLRRFLADRTEGRLYGEIGKTTGKAIEEWVDRNERKEKRTGRI